MMAHSTNARILPADLGAPPAVDRWRSRALLTGIIFSVLAAVLALLDRDPIVPALDHVLRGWVLGMMLTFGWSVGGLALLMVQYCSGGKWGLLLRRPLEAMTRSLPLVFGYWVVSAIFMRHLYLWAKYTNPGDTAEALKQGLINEAQAHCLDFKRPMLNPTTYIVVMLICFAIWFFYMWRLNGLGLKRDTESLDSTPYWIKKLENISGPGIVVYSLTMTA